MQPFGFMQSISWPELLFVAVMTAIPLVITIIMVRFFYRAARNENPSPDGRKFKVEDRRGRGFTQGAPTETEATWVCGRPDCHAENPNHAKFCRQCGQEAVDRPTSCPHCGGFPASNDKFCIFCGTPLPAGVRG